MTSTTTYSVCGWIVVNEITKQIEVVIEETGPENSITERTKVKTYEEAWRELREGLMGANIFQLTNENGDEVEHEQLEKSNQESTKEKRKKK